MKNKIFMIMLAGALLTGCNNNATTYEKEVIVAITTHDTVMFEDENGYLSRMVKPNHQYIEGEIGRLVMSDNGTKNDIFDDVPLEYIKENNN